MRALTLWRPWAAAILLWGKDIENRPWRPPGWILGERVLIHNGKVFDREGAGVIAEALAQPVIEDGEVHHVQAGPLSVDVLQPGRIVGSVRILGAFLKDAPDRVFVGEVPPDRVSSPWAFGPWCWVLSEPELLCGPVVRGGQGFWTAPDLCATPFPPPAVRP